MIEKSKNKSITPEIQEIRNKLSFFYPDYQVTVEAESKEDADEKVKEVLKKLDGKEKTE